MAHLVLLARLLLGAVFTFSGLNMFFLWVEPGPGMPPGVEAFVATLEETGFMQPLRGATEALGGVLVLTGIWLPLGLTLLAPVLLHVTLYTLYLDPAGLGLCYALVGLELFLAFAYGSAFKGMLSLKAKPRWSVAAQE